MINRTTVQQCNSTKVQKCKNGFTIIELLISLSILIIVLGAVYATFFTVQRALDRFNNISLKYHEARTALDIIRREIESSFVESAEPGDEKDKKITRFSFKDKDIFGKPASELQMTAFSFRSIGLNTISYHVEEDGDILKLMKKESPALLPSNGYSLEMIYGIEGFSVETFFKQKWIRVWDADEAGILPDMVRVTIEFSDNGKKISLREYARPAIGMQL